MTKKSPKNIKIFECENCDYSCSKKGDWNRHLLTRKHKIVTNTDTNTSKTFICECGKSYKHRQNLHAHKKKCDYEEKVENIQEEKTEENELNYKDMFLVMMNENKELKGMMKEMIPNIGNNNNSHNTQFNINVFLNEQCKDALNIMDFVDSLQLQLKDLDNTGKLGFVEGTSKIFIDGLNKLEVTKRPIHCSDIKEETLYIKDNDTWEKENKNKDKIKKAIDRITDINMDQMPEWVKENPKFANDDEYLKVISNIMNVIDKGKQNKQKEQIINNVAQETFIDE
tara:strand:- start:436 stop:1284 length:849 start_codon:yes stop_codon:yes gene_type:complete